MSFLHMISTVFARSSKLKFPLDLSKFISDSIEHSQAKLSLKQQIPDK